MGVVWVCEIRYGRGAEHSDEEWKEEEVVLVIHAAAASPLHPQLWCAMGGWVCGGGEEGGEGMGGVEWCAWGGGRIVSSVGKNWEKKNGGLGNCGCSSTT